MSVRKKKKKPQKIGFSTEELFQFPKRSPAEVADDDDRFGLSYRKSISPTDEGKNDLKSIADWLITTKINDDQTERAHGHAKEPTNNCHENEYHQQTDGQNQDHDHYYKQQPRSVTIPYPGYKTNQLFNMFPKQDVPTKTFYNSKMTFERNLRQLEGPAQHSKARHERCHNRWITESPFVLASNDSEDQTNRN